MARDDRNGDGARHAELPLTHSQRLRIRVVLWVLLLGLGCVGLHLTKLQLFRTRDFPKTKIIT